MKGMRIAPFALPLLLALCTLHTGCKGRTAAPLTEQEIAVLCEAGEQDEDCAALIAEYRRTGNAALATEAGTTMLHLACSAGKESLMRHLLAAGANADAFSEEYGTPLTVLTARLDHNGDKVQFRRLTEILQQAGAHLNEVVISDALDEAAYLDLLKRFPAPQSGEFSPAVPAALMGWVQALGYYLEHAPHPLQGADSQLLCHVARCDGAHPQSSYVECAKLLLQHGLSADENPGDPSGPSPLLWAAYGAQSPECGQEPGLGVITYLLRNGANPNRCTDEGECAYDYLVSLKDELEEAGTPLPPPVPLEYTEGLDLLTTVLRADRREAPVEELRTAFGQIAQVLHPTAEMAAWKKRHITYADARLAAIRLLARADAVQAANAVAAMPVWADGTLIPAKGEPVEELELLLQQLHDLHLPLPAPIVMQLAETLCERNETQTNETAASAVELLAYGEETDELLEQLRQDARLPLQAGAWQATLLRKGLPTSKIGDLEGWMQENGLTAATPALQRLLRLTDWGRLLSAEEKKQIIADLKAIGLPDAEQRLRHLNTADETGEDNAQATETAYLLEIAAARYMLEHEADFRAAQQQAAEKEQ